MSDVIKQPAGDIAADQSPEVNFALVLSRMIDSVEQDPAQLRATVYELARIKLMEQFGGEDDKEVKRLVGALETAISGVESFSRQQQQVPRAALAPPQPGGHADEPSAISDLKEAANSETSPFGTRGSQAFGSVIRLCVVMAIVVLAGGITIYWPRLKSMYQEARTRSAVVATSPQLQEASPSAASVTPPAEPAPRPSPDFPVPATFGIYAVTDGQLQELKPLPGRIPDRRVAMSAAISGASQTILANGNARFVVFRRDAATSAPDNAEVRVIAKVTRAMGVDASGKAVVTPAQDSWVVRNISLPYKTGPVDGHQEMYLVQSENTDAWLPPGRYALVIKGQGYDFAVDGAVTDPRQCVERVDAVNGAFYSPCPEKR